MENLNQTLDSIPDIVYDTMDAIGFLPHLKGYKYLAYGVSLLLKDPSKLDYITKILYPEIAKAFDTTSSRVERAIRHIIEVSLADYDEETIDKYLGTGASSSLRLRGKITNSHCLASLSMYIRKEMRLI